MRNAFVFDREILPVLIFGFAIFLLIFLNILAVYLIIKRALSKYVKPKLQAAGLTFIDYRWAGFSSDEFKNGRSDWSFVYTRGNPFISIYAFVFFKDSGVNKHVTIKINTAFLFITSVIYSREF